MRAIDFPEALTAGQNDFVPVMADIGGGTYAERKIKVPALQPPKTAGGRLILPTATSTGVITGLALPAIPQSVVVSVQKPANGQNIFASVIGDPTVDGFAFELSADTDTNTYVLHYVINF